MLECVIPLLVDVTSDGYRERKSCECTKQYIRSFSFRGIGTVHLSQIRIRCTDRTRIKSITAAKARGVRTGRMLAKHPKGVETLRCQ